jgi:hypothetical protein
MSRLKEWWFNELPVEVKLVFLALLANALPAITILMTLPGHTETMFVWTVKPVINARLLGVMYANALMLVVIGAFQRSWGRARIVVFLVTLFSILATVLTFVYLKPFLAHPWFHLTYWLLMYLVLFFGAPYVLVTQERKNGGRLPVQVPLNRLTRVLAVVLALVSFVCSLALFFAVDAVSQVLPWNLPPLVGGLIGVLFFTHAAAYVWALWDGDWLRTRPIFWQAPLTALLFLLLPLMHRGDLEPYTGSALTLYAIMAGVAVLIGLVIVMSYRTEEPEYASPTE